MHPNKTVSLLLTVVLLVATIIPLASITFAHGHHWKLYTEALSSIEKGNHLKAVTLLEEAVKYSSNASYYRKLAEAYTALNEFQKAADAYYREAEIHLELSKSSGNMNTYLAVMAKANALNTEASGLPDSTKKPVSSMPCSSRITTMVLTFLH